MKTIKNFIREIVVAILSLVVAYSVALICRYSFELDDVTYGFILGMSFIILSDIISMFIKVAEKVIEAIKEGKEDDK